MAVRVADSSRRRAAHRREGAEHSRRDGEEDERGQRAHDQRERQAHGEPAGCRLAGSSPSGVGLVGEAVEHRCEGQAVATGAAERRHEGQRAAGPQCPVSSARASANPAPRCSRCSVACEARPNGGRGRAGPTRRSPGSASIRRECTSRAARSRPASPLQSPGRRAVRRCAGDSPPPATTTPPRIATPGPTARQRQRRHQPRQRRGAGGAVPALTSPVEIVAASTGHGSDRHAGDAATAATTIAPATAAPATIPRRSLRTSDDPAHPQRTGDVEHAAEDDHGESRRCARGRRAPWRR